MPKFTVAELAKKYGIARTSIYDRMKNGSISYEIDDKNRKVIDLSEMQRVYGTPDSKDYNQADSSKTNNTTIELYKQLIEELRHDKLVAEERERRMYKEIDQLKDKIDNLTLALGYTPKNIEADNQPDSTNEQNRTNFDVQKSTQIAPNKTSFHEQEKPPTVQFSKKSLFRKFVNLIVNDKE